MKIEIMRRHQRRRDLREQAEEEFNEIFWPQVQHKVRRGHARTAYVSMRTSKDKVDWTPQELVDAYNAYANEVRVTKYIMHPCNWISGRCWEDEPIEQSLSIEERIQRLEQSEKVTVMKESCVHHIGVGQGWILRVGNPNPMAMLGEVAGQWTYVGNTLEQCLHKAEVELL